MRAVVMLSVHNEADILRDVIENLIDQELRIVALDNGSDDGAYEICQSYRDRGQIVLDRWEPEGIDLGGLTRRLYGMALECDADWLLWSDGDELLQAVGPDRNLREVIEEADDAANNIVQFDRFDFFMTDEDDPRESSIPARLRHYSWQGDYNYRAWKYSPGIRAEPSLAHLPIFPDGVPYRIHPEKQVLRHYPSRSPAQAQAKLETLVGKFGEDPGNLAGWQRRYVRLVAEGEYAQNMPAEKLALDQGDHAWRREPLFTPFVDAQPTRSELFTADGRLKISVPPTSPLEVCAGESGTQLD
jgi:glycosyltransferase involved in cell wall biosynthesis